MFTKNLSSPSMCLKTIQLLLIAILPTSTFPQPTGQAIVPGAAKHWTLQSSVEQAISTSPELKKSTAELGVRQADIDLASLWPDPELSLRVDSKMGRDDNSGGYDLTDVTVWQSIPISRIQYQEEAASASMKAARFSRQFESLQVQNRVSKVFHQLQFSSAKLSLAEKQLAMAKKLNGKDTNKSHTVVRYLSPLEKMRLTIIREEAKQAADSAEGHYSEALSEFVKLLGVEMGSVSSVSELLPVAHVPDLKYLTELQNNHAQLSSQQQEVFASNHEIDVARSSQMIDPSIGLSWQRDTIRDGRQDYYAIMFNVQIPISDRRIKAESKATYKAGQQKIELQLLKRELRINLNRSYTHLNHVIEQAVEYKKKVLKPAARMLELTHKGFSSGELNILSLVDANKTHFQTQLTYLELLYQARVELAEVKLYAGQLITDKQNQHDTTINNHLSMGAQ